MKTPQDKLAKIYTNCSGHMTKMANTPIYGKNPVENLFLQNQKADDLGTWYIALRMHFYEEILKYSFFLKKTLG